MEHRRVFKGLVKTWADRIGVRPARIQVQAMTAKWASCSRTGRISFNTDLLTEDVSFQEVVIVHELLHLIVPNHGKLFKSLLTAYLPEWERIAGGRISRCCVYNVLRRSQSS